MWYDKSGGTRGGRTTGESGAGEMKTPDPDTLLFFAGNPDALEVYLAFEARLAGAFPCVNRRVQKTQITFFNRHVFACVSFVRVRKKAELPAGWITVTFGLPRPLDSERVAAKSEPRPGRWTHHVVVSRPEELDGELFSWLRESYDFAEAPR